MNANHCWTSDPKSDLVDIAMNTEPCTCTHNANSKIINSKNAIVMKYSQAWVNRLKVMKLRQVWFPIPTTAVYERESMVAVILLISSIANLWTTEDQWIRSHVDITNGLLLCRFSLDENFHYHLFLKYCWCRILWSLLSVVCGYCLKASTPMWTSLWMKTFAAFPPTLPDSISSLCGVLLM